MGFCLGKKNIEILIIKRKIMLKKVKLFRKRFNFIKNKYLFECIKICFAYNISLLINFYYIFNAEEIV